MDNILTTILKAKKGEIAVAKNDTPLSILQKKIKTLPRCRNFYRTLAKKNPHGINVIAEIKRASPSKGIICPDLNPVTYASQFERGGAAALSVLTDQPHFQGSVEDLKSARKSTKLPVLRKDFLISSYQLYESAVMGADAVLLITRILEQEQLKDYLNICNELKMDALVEIHSEKDLESANKAGARLIAINNRNLQSFETNIETAIRLKLLLEPHQVAVAASGIRTRADIEKNQKSGIWNFLIGESLVRTKNPVNFLKSLIS